MRAILLFIFLLLHAQYNFARDSSAVFWEQLKIDKLDSLKIPCQSVSDYWDQTNYAIRLSKDTNKANAEKGAIIIAVLAEHIKGEFTHGHLSIHNDSTEKLLKVYEALNYHIYQHKSSLFLKAAHHVCECNYDYLLKRAKSTSFFYPGCFIVLVLCVLLILAWRKKLNLVFKRVIIVSLLFIILLFIGFNFTCKQYVTTHSFYGIDL